MVEISAGNQLGNSIEDAELTTKTNYLSLTGADFTSNAPATDVVTFGNSAVTPTSATMYAPIHLPQGAVVTNIIIYGTAGAEDKNYYLKRFNSAFAITTMAQALVNSADATIDNATIDNATYGYFIQTDNLVAGENIWLAVITFTSKVPTS
jgi:hypothetical protein